MDEGIKQPDLSNLCTKPFVVPCTRCGHESVDVSKTHIFNINAIDPVSKFHAFPLCWNCASIEFIHGPDKEIR